MAKAEKKLKKKEEVQEASFVKGQFNQKAFQKELGSPEELMLFKCPECEGVHFRHTGYLEQMTPFVAIQVNGPPEMKSATNSLPVKTCVSCKHSYIDVQGKMYDVTKHIDLKAWEKTEKEMTKATGPGGEC